MKSITHEEICSDPFFIFRIEILCQEIPNTLTPAEKVYGLSRFWQEVNYNFVYLYKVDRQAWDSAYKALIPAGGTNQK